MSFQRYIANPKNDPVNSRLVDDNATVISKTNPLPTQDIDGTNRTALNTVFGERIMGVKKPSFAAQFQYGIASDQSDTSFVNGGTATTSNSLLSVSTGTAADGEARIQTTEYLRYVPGHEAYINFTGVYTTPKANTWQRLGLFDDDNGFFIGYEGTQFTATRRREGTDYNDAIDVSTIYDDGTFDPTKGNIYRITFGYLGFACISFEVLNPNGSWKLIHKIEYPNTSEVSHVMQTNLPARAHIANTGNTTDMVVKVGSYECGIINGGGADPSSRLFSSQLSNITITAGNYVVAVFRNKTTFNSIENRVKARLMLLTCATDLSKISTWGIYKNSTITNSPTWTDINTTDSTFEYSTNATVTFGTGTILLPWSMGKTENIFQDVEHYLVDIKAGETATIFVSTPGGTTGDINIGFRWKELF